MPQVSSSASGWAVLAWVLPLGSTGCPSPPTSEAAAELAPVTETSFDQARIALPASWRVRRTASRLVAEAPSSTAGSGRIEASRLASEAASAQAAADEQRRQLTAAGLTVVEQSVRAFGAGTAARTVYEGSVRRPATSSGVPGSEPSRRYVEACFTRSPGMLCIACSAEPGPFVHVCQGADRVFGSLSWVDAAAP